MHLGNRDVERVHSVPLERAEDLSARGLPVPPMCELKPDSAELFYDAVAELKRHNLYAASLHVYKADEYAGMRMFLTPDATAGVALCGTEIVSLFAYRDSEWRGSSPAMLALAVAEGGNNLSCFNTKLPRMYAQEGFVPAARTPWNDRFAPPEWNPRVYAEYNGGMPDVIFSAYQERAIGSDFDQYRIPVVPDFQSGIEAVGRVLYGSTLSPSRPGL